MKRKLLFASLLLGLTMPATAQDYEWQWAKRGGGTKPITNESPSAEWFYSEQIIDIAVDADNNYYYLAYMGQNLAEYDGVPATVYNTMSNTYANIDVFLISTDCEGTLRWTQTIGSAVSDYTYNIQVDNNGGLYLGANFTNASYNGPEYTVPHFSPDDAMGIIPEITGEPNEEFKTIALLKYNTDDGSLAWRVMPQGSTTFELRQADMGQIQIDSEGTIHALIGFLAGTHLNGTITVPDTFSSNLNGKYYIVKYDADGNLINALPLSLEGVVLGHFSDFRYDEGLGRYYLTGCRNNGGTDPYINLSFSGVPFTGQAYILAFSATGAELWRRESSYISNFNDFRISDLEIDADHSLYMSGRYFNDHNTGGVAFGDYEIPNDLAGNIIYVMKFDSSGAVQWLKRPSGYTAPGGIFTGMYNAYDLDINGNEVVVATQVNCEIFDDIVITRPTNHRSDAALLRLDKATGGAIAVDDIMGYPEYDDVFTAVQRDNDGNYVTGGAFHYDIFTAEDDNVPTIHKVGGQDQFSDFFVAKLANVPCGTGTVGVEEVKAGDFNIYPNPSTGIVNIHSQEQLSSYEIVNMLGQVLLKGNLEQSQNQILIESLSVGTYIITVKTTDNKSISRKVVKE